MLYGQLLLAHAHPTVPRVQKVTITGLRVTFFQEAMEALKEVNFTAEREFCQGELEAWTPTTFKGSNGMH
ncbi:uncharacterized protein ARMOST_18161 [Armillaria ostoyae]|uniref:Uncharacterized protein n=1 Tax=Armillaria ostoyae TaxID=47428 RepID=A0A284S113_ARMOS|nr:uncharacterized protein ARMOST_18161 [Armillaria ostoyae]